MSVPITDDEFVRPARRMRAGKPSDGGRGDHLARKLPATCIALGMHIALLAVLWRASSLPWQAARADDPIVAVLLRTPDTDPPRAIPRPVDLPPAPIIPVLLDLPVVEGPPSPIRVAPAAPAPVAPAAEPTAGPLALGSDLAIGCPDRQVPRYPADARRRREQGTVTLRVELAESGRVAQVTVAKSSGSRALDDAAVDAIRAWRCSPAERDGRPVRAIATQALDFVLERR